LHAICVLEGRDSVTEPEPGEVDERRTFARETLDEVETRASRKDVEVTTSLVEGGRRVHRSVVDYADEYDADCIVMGTHGRDGLDRFVLGSVTERTVSDSTVPVITVHDDTVLEAPFDSLLVATDGSEAADAAVEHAVELALATGATLHVVHVVDLSIVFGDYDRKTILDQLEEPGRAAVDRAVARAESAGVLTVETAIRRGVPHRELLGYVADHGVDCIVMGTRGRTGLERSLLGSVAERVIRLSDVPVVTLDAAASSDRPE